MNKSLLRIKKMMMEASNMTNFMECLNLKENSYFLCLLALLEDAILDYDDMDCYEYLFKVLDEIESIYLKLSKKERNSYRKHLLLLKDVYKRNIFNIEDKDRRYFERVYVILNTLSLNKKEEMNQLDSHDLSTLLYKIIFSLKDLDYLDKLIKIYPSILNSVYEDNLIFNYVILEYINQVILNNDKLIGYYERVLNKFFLEPSFTMTEQVKEDNIKKLSSFVKSKKNLKIERVEEIRKLISSIYHIAPLFELFNINKKEFEIPEEELEIAKLNSYINQNRVRVNGDIITIDGIGTEVLDDAISSIEKLPNGNLLYKVHIADPIALFSYSSSVIQSAKYKASTIYSGNEVIQMFPSSLSCDKLSLLKNKDRFAKTFCFEFDNRFNLVNYYFLNTIIRVTERQDYNTLNELYKVGGKSKVEEENLRYYDDLIQSLQKMFQNAKSYESIKLGSSIGNNQKMDGFSEKLVSYSMMLVGFIVSKYFYENKLPYAYRCHDTNSNLTLFLDEYLKKTKDPLIKEMKNCTAKSYYSRENKAHEGLNLRCYSHITSPLRRFCDLLNMHALEICYFKKPTDIDIYRLEREIDKTCSYLNTQSNTIDEYIRFKSKIKK